MKSLRKYSLKYGLKNNKLRSLVWPILLQLPTISEEENPFEKNTENVHKDQIQKDVERSFYSDWCTFDFSVKMQKRKILSNILNGILSKHPELSYYQGYHDICSIILFVESNKKKNILYDGKNK
eukprot:TRINITY_DN9710_c0_g1_i1.p1 TRINITY_DN9710_c0_g1~~TRINITY_DN9710_c0_g1_i1.p1  ORF type:complete len:138 (-),score=22.91 TRINITY_DN9710_c0_g1_i1:122-493(-)